MPDKSAPQHPLQRQSQPGLESQMTPRPEAESNAHRPAGKLVERVAVITGGDSGIGRAVAIAFAKEGADVVVGHLEAERGDAEETAARVKELGRKCVLFSGDIGRPDAC